MSQVSVVIPNYNGAAYLKACLDSLYHQTFSDFEIILVDNASTDGSYEMAVSDYPDVRFRRLDSNTGFCHAVNTGIEMSDAEYVLLLNNDTWCAPEFVEALLSGIRRHPDAFCVQARMVRMDDPSRLDNAGDFYCALGWAFSMGKDLPAGSFAKERRIFSGCAGAALYRRAFLDRIGLFDEVHFAYLEDVDLGYRSLLAGYENWYIPEAVVHHAGSAASGSRHNSFKVWHTVRNNLYMVRKNMPLPQLVLNAPLLFAGWLVKAVYFARKGLLRDYRDGTAQGLRLSVRKSRKHLQDVRIRQYLYVQLELWFNLVRLFENALGHMLNNRG